MTDPDPMAMFEVEKRLVHLTELLTRNTERLTRAYDRRNEAQHEYDTKNAMAYLGQTEGTIPERKAKALLACIDEHLELIMARGEVSAAQSETTALLKSIEVLRSINTNVRDRAWHPTGRGG